MTTENIFSNDILNGDLTTSLVPELGTEDILVDITPYESGFTDPLTQELSLTEPEVVVDEIDNDNNLSPNNSQLFNNIWVANIDPLIAANAEEFQVNAIDVNDTSFAPPQSELQFQGGFGDYDGGDDITLEIEDTDGNVVETFSLTGEGQATLYRDEESQYIFFSGVDETTKVDIDSTSNIKFGNYIGDSLKIETTGSIDGGDIILSEPDETGLVLKSGVESSNQGNLGYSVTGLDNFYVGSSWYYEKRLDINNLGQVVGRGRNNNIQLYSGGTITDLGFLNIEEESVSHLFAQPTSINDLGQIVGYSEYIGRGTTAFIYSDGEIRSSNSFESSLNSMAFDINNSGQLISYERIATRSGSTTTSSYALITYQNELSFVEPLIVIPGSLIVGTSINDSGQTVGWTSDYHSPSERYVETAFLNSNGATSSLGYLGYDSTPGRNGFPSSSANEINNLGQVVGRSTNSSGKSVAFLYSDGSMTDLGILPGHLGGSEARAINDLSQIVGFCQTSIDGSYAESGFVYQDGQMYDLNNLIPEDSGWVIEHPEAINNQGQIVGFGKQGYRKKAFLLDPIITASETKVTVSNISTFGDTVLLQGDEITLIGNAITTNGGEITLNGATTVNSNLTIDSSVTEDEVIIGGGDITFTGTLDAASAGSGNLRLQAGTGNIFFGDAVGGETTFENINILGADIVTANADITSDEVVRINATGDVVTQNIISDNGRVVLSSQQKSISTLDITSGSEERDNIILEAGDSVSTRNLSANELGVVRIASGQYLEEDSTVVGDVTTESITGRQIRVDSAGNFTALGDALAHDGNVVVDARLDITAENITANNGNVRLTSEEKSIAANDIKTIIPEAVTDEEKTRKGNIILEAIEGVTTANLNGGESGTVRITSGEIVENDTETLEDDTILVGDITTQGITGKAVRAVGTGSFTATGDITAHDGRITVAVKDDVNTKGINSLANSINLISTEGAVTVDGDLNSENGGIAIHAANNVNAKKIRSFDGAVALSSYDGEITVEDDINTVRGGVTIAAKEGVEVARITTGIGEVNIGSGKAIVANGNISTNVGYVNLKAGGSLNLQSVTTNDGYISLGADSNIEVSGLATSSGVINLVSATGSVAAGSIDTEGSYVAIEAALEIIASAIEANGGGVDLVANSDFGGLGLIASGGVTDAATDAVDSLNELIISQQEFISEIVNDLIYHRRDIAEFILGVLYETAANNLEDAFNFGQFILPYKLTERDKRYWNQIIEGKSDAFQLGRELADAVSVVQGMIELFTGGAAIVSASSLCVATAGATLGASCFAAAPAIASGAALSAHGLSLIEKGLRNDTDANLIDDLLAPQKMESTGGADGIRGLSRETGISQESIQKVYGDVSSEDIKLLGDKLNKNLAEHLFNKGGDGSTGSQLVNNVAELIGRFNKSNDDVAIDSIKGVLRKNQRGKLSDSKTETAFSEAADFLERYDGKVSGDFPSRFADAQGKKGAAQARNEIRVAENLLDGNSPLGNIGKVDGIPTDVSNTGIPTPDYKATDINNLSSLVEVKTPNGLFKENNLQRNLNGAIDQIKRADGTFDKGGYIVIDYSLQPPTNISRARLEEYTQTLITDANATNIIEFVEILYKNDAGDARLLLQVKNGVMTILN